MPRTSDSSSGPGPCERNLTFYDGLYVALAERLDMVLVTLDARLEAAPGLRGRIEVIGGAR